MLEKKFSNEDLGIELTSYIDNKQMFGSQEKMLLRYLVIVKQEMHYHDMLITRINN